MSTDLLRTLLAPLRGYPTEDGNGNRRWTPDRNGAYLGFEDAIDALAASRPISTEPEGLLRTALDNLATHHELERVAGNTHTRPDRCEFVEQARAALATQSRGLDAERESLSAQIEHVHRQSGLSRGHGMADWSVCEHPLCVSARPFAANQAPETEGEPR